MILVLGIMLIGCSGNNDNQQVNKNTESSQPAEEVKRLNQMLKILRVHM